MAVGILGNMLWVFAGFAAIKVRNRAYARLYGAFHLTC